MSPPRRRGSAAGSSGRRRVGRARRDADDNSEPKTELSLGPQVPSLSPQRRRSDRCDRWSSRHLSVPQVRAAGRRGVVFVE